ncbi:MAG: fructose-bisphosphatase class III, partial [Clostridia bacterium]|nr:fructose-bisphosphatase class III [Clostridia bacterium]
PFVGHKRAVAENFDIASSTNVFERLDGRQKIEETDTGRELTRQINDLMLLLDAYHDGVVAEDHKSK